MVVVWVGMGQFAELRSLVRLVVTNIAIKPLSSECHSTLIKQAEGQGCKAADNKGSVSKQPRQHTNRGQKPFKAQPQTTSSSNSGQAKQHTERHRTRNLSTLSSNTSTPTHSRLTVNHNIHSQPITSVAAQYNRHTSQQSLLLLTHVDPVHIAVRIIRRCYCCSI